MLTGRWGQVEGTGSSGTLFVGEMEVNHGGGNIRVPEDVLHGADVGVGIEEMRCKAMTEGVAGDAFGDRGLFEGLFQLPLHGVLEKMVSGKASGLRMSAELGGGEKKTPGELQRGIGIFPLKGGREVHGGTIVPEMFQMLLFEFFDMLSLRKSGWRGPGSLASRLRVSQSKASAHFRRRRSQARIRADWMAWSNMLSRASLAEGGRLETAIPFPGAIVILIGAADLADQG